jgi:hypothetical protein
MNQHNQPARTIVQPEQAQFSDYDEFARVVGLITDPAKLKTLGVPAGFCQETGMYSTEHLTVLQEFCRAHQQFHLATLTSDGDDCESDEYALLWEKHGADGGEWEDLPEETQDEWRERWQVSALTMNNRVSIVNRLGYYLCDGQTDGNLSLLEITTQKREVGL